MNLGALFKNDPRKKQLKENRKLEKLLYQFSQSDDLNNPISHDKKFRTITFWENTEDIIPVMFNNWLKKMGHNVDSTEGGFLFKNSLYFWSTNTFKFSDYEDYYIEYNFKTSVEDPNPYRYHIRKLIVKIENTFPKKVLVFYLDNKMNQFIVTGKYMKKEEITDLNSETIHQYLESNLNVSKRIKTTMSIYGLEQNNEILIIARRNAEMHFQKIAESYLNQMAKRGLPLEGIPFQDLLDEQADYLKKNLIDDYDLHQWDTNRFQLEKAIRLAKNKIITKYLNT